MTVLGPPGPYSGTRLLVAGAEQWSNRFGLVVNGGGAYVSTDGGRSWVPASGGLTAMSIRSLSVSKDDTWVYAGSDDGGVHRTRSTMLLPSSAVGTTSTRVRVRETIRAGMRPTIRVRVGAPGAWPTGAVLVTMQRAGGRRFSTVRNLAGGTATWRAPVLRRSGRYVVRVVYRPTGLYRASSGRDVVRVLKHRR